MDAAAAAARRAFPDYAGWSPVARAALLDRVPQLILARAELFARALSTEMGAAISYALSAHVPLAAEHIRVARDLAKTYPFATRRGSTLIVREPIGVCGLITPWNGRCTKSPRMSGRRYRRAARSSSSLVPTFAAT